MTFLHLFIVNKSGGLIHHRPLLSSANKSQVPTIGTNEWLRIASTFHSLHAIAAEAGPVARSGRADDGIEEIRAAGFLLHCLPTVTGLKFVLTAATTPDNEMAWSKTLAQVLQEIYILYTECVLKDPFYELEMPIRSELFGQAVDALLQRHAGSSGKAYTAPAKLLY